MLNSKMLNFNTFVPLCRKTRSSSTFFKFGMGKTNQSFKFNIFCYVSCRLHRRNWLSREVPSVFFFYALLFKTIIFLPVHELLLALHGMMKLYFYSKDKPYKLNGKLHFLCSVKSPLTGWKNAILFLKEHIWKVYTLNKRKKIIF